MTVFVVAALLMSSAIHIVCDLIMAGSDLSLAFVDIVRRGIMWGQLLTLLLSLPWEKRPPKYRFVGLLLTQTAYMLIFFGLGFSMLLRGDSPQWDLWDLWPTFTQATPKL